MKYSIEYKNGEFVETLEFDGNEATKTWKREDEGNICGLCSKDKDFSEQFEEVMDEDVVSDIYNTFDTNEWVADIEDFIMISGVE